MLLTQEQRNIIAQAQTIAMYALNEKGAEITCIDSSKEFIKAALQGREREVFGVLAMDSQHRVISFDILFQGTINSASVHIREIIKYLLERNAAAVIVCHNHPGGKSDPSLSDIATTRRIKYACELMDISLLDHLIVGTDICSLAQRGDM